MTFFHKDDLLEEAKKVMLETRYRAYPVVDDANRLIGVVSRYHLLAMQQNKSSWLITTRKIRLWPVWKRRLFWK